MSKTFYGSFIAVAFAAMVVLPTTVIGQQSSITIDGQGVAIKILTIWWYENYASVGTATVTPPTKGEPVHFYNYGNITDATINGPSHTNTGSGIAIHNRGTITKATVNGGTFNNGDTATDNVGTIENATVNDGKFYNQNGSSITNLTINGGLFNNRGGLVYDQNGGSITNLTINGGQFYAGGIVDNLKFGENGNGIVSFNAFVDGGNIGFGGINATTVDLTYGNIVFGLGSLPFAEEDMLSALFADDGFMLSALFGTANVTGMESMNSVAISLNAGRKFFILNDGVIAEGWDVTNGIVTWIDGGGGGGGFDFPDDPKPVVPEPATLLMLGLAAAGLPVVRRWRKG